MWRLIKWIVFLAIISGVALWITGYKVRGKTIQEHLKPVLEDKAVKESIRDLRSIVGEGLKAAGEAVSEDVTDNERKQLDEMVKNELMSGKPIEGAPSQEALPPEIKTPAQAAAPRTTPAPVTPPVTPQTQPANTKK